MSNGFTFHEPPEVRYRHYRYNGSRTTPNGLEILSVTQALGVLDKSGPLQGYAAKITLEGVAAVLEKGARDVSKPRRAVSADELAALLRRGRLTFRDRTGDAQNRGKAVHKALEDWINEGAIPQPDKYPAGWRGYIRALAGWLAAERPTFEESEAVVGSVEHGFAGTRDTVAIVRDPKRGRVLLDAKTSKAVYPSSMFRQLAAYEMAGVECGSEPTNAQGILRLGLDGSWEVRWLQDLGELDFFKAAFLRALAACRDERRIKDAEKAATKAGAW